MAREKVLVIIAAGAGLIGATLYSMRKGKPATEDHRNVARQKRDLGLGGAGIGGNMIAGGPEKGRTISPPTSAGSKDKLPAGQIGGGEGAGGSSARKTQIAFTGSNSNGTFGNDQTGKEGQNGAKTLPSGKSDWMNSLKSTVGGQSTASRADQQGLHDTRGISKMGHEVPSKRGPADASN